MQINMHQLSKLASLRQTETNMLVKLYKAVHHQEMNGVIKGTMLEHPNGYHRQLWVRGSYC
jgi:hypothetical protein